jgi:hypothetical protein
MRICDASVLPASLAQAVKHMQRIRTVQAREESRHISGKQTASLCSAVCSASHSVPEHRQIAVCGPCQPNGGYA